LVDILASGNIAALRASKKPIGIGSKMKNQTAEINNGEEHMRELLQLEIQNGVKVPSYRRNYVKDKRRGGTCTGTDHGDIKKPARRYDWKDGGQWK